MPFTPLTSPKHRCIYADVVNMSRLASSFGVALLLDTPAQLL